MSITNCLNIIPSSNISLATINMGVRGDKGDKGDQGIPGIPGITGITGLSSYEIAVSNGYVGTEADWLTSLGDITPVINLINTDVWRQPVLTADFSYMTIPVGNGDLSYTISGVTGGDGDRVLFGALFSNPNVYIFDATNNIFVEDTRLTKNGDTLSVLLGFYAGKRFTFNDSEEAGQDPKWYSLEEKVKLECNDYTDSLVTNFQNSIQVVLKLTAPVNIGGNRVVMASGYYADNTDLATVNRAVGITKTSAIINDPVVIVCAGEVDGFSGLTINDPIYLSSNGTVTQTPPVTGYQQRIGVALSATLASIKLSDAIIL